MWTLVIFLKSYMKPSGIIKILLLFSLHSSCNRGDKFAIYSKANVIRRGGKSQDRFYNVIKGMLMMKTIATRKWNSNASHGLKACTIFVSYNCDYKANMQQLIAFLYCSLNVFFTRTSIRLLQNNCTSNSLYRKLLGERCCLHYRCSLRIYCIKVKESKRV